MKLVFLLWTLAVAVAGETYTNPLANESIATGKILDVTERLGRELRSYRK